MGRKRTTIDAWEIQEHTAGGYEYSCTEYSRRDLRMNMKAYQEAGCCVRSVKRRIKFADMDRPEANDYIVARTDISQLELHNSGEKNVILVAQLISEHLENRPTINKIARNLLKLPLTDNCCYIKWRAAKELEKQAKLAKA